MISTRAIKQVDIDIVEKYIDWDKLACPIVYKRSNRGRPPKLTNVQILKIVYLQEKEHILHDTDMAKFLNTNCRYKEFLDYHKSEEIAHDLISKIKRKISKKTWLSVQQLLDKELEKLNYFKNDNLSFDGTDLRTHVKSKIGNWGAKSDNKKFHGLWLMALNSTNHEIVRQFEIDDAKIGQIILAKKVLRKAKTIDLSNIEEICGDGIFDTKEIRDIIKDNLRKRAVIPYNCKNSKIRDSKDLPDDDWRLESTEFLRDKEEFKKHYKKRTGSERENSRLKEWTLVGRTEEKTTRCPKIKRKSIINQAILSIIFTQTTALGEWLHQLEYPITVQTNLESYVELATC